jgi:DNA-binding NarL/FixJ family response regulator
MKRCLICDDHALLREALVGMVLAAWPEAEIAQAASFPEAWAAAAEEYDLCLADLRMPGAGPLEGIAGIRKEAPDLPLLVVTGTADDREMLALLDMGVAGFITKTTGGAMLEAAIRLIMAGGRYVPERLAEIMPAALTTKSATTVQLTARQRDVIRLTAQGLSNKEIARALGIAPSSVKTHLTAAQELLGTSNRAQTSVRAQALNLI